MLKRFFSHRNRALLRELVITDFKLRYQGSVLGYLWSLVRPLFLFSILLVVFGYVLNVRSNIVHYPVYLLLGIVLWNFFIEATNNGLQSIVGRGDLLRKVNFPRYIIVISGTISALINLLISLVVVFVFMDINGITPQLDALWFPIILLELYIFSLAASFVLAALYVKYRDISYIWELVTQAGFYATPIIYPLSLVISKSPLMAKLMLLNPLAQIIQDSRYVLVNHQAQTLLSVTHHPAWMLVPITVILLTVAGALSYFRVSSRQFAEIV